MQSVLCVSAETRAHARALASSVKREKQHISLLFHLPSGRHGPMLDRTKAVTPNEAVADSDDDWVDEWTNYVPDPIVISEARRQELREEA